MNAAAVAEVLALIARGLFMVEQAAIALGSMSEAVQTILKAQQEGRDLTDEEFAKSRERLYAAIATWEKAEAGKGVG